MASAPLLPRNTRNTVKGLLFAPSPAVTAMVQTSVTSASIITFNISAVTLVLVLMLTTLPISTVAGPAASRPPPVRDIARAPVQGTTRLIGRTRIVAVHMTLVPGTNQFLLLERMGADKRDAYWASLFDYTNNRSTIVS